MLQLGALPKPGRRGGQGGGGCIECLQKAGPSQKAGVLSASRQLVSVWPTFAAASWALTSHASPQATHPSFPTCGLSWGLPPQGATPPGTVFWPKCQHFFLKGHSGFFSALVGVWDGQCDPEKMS